MAKISDMSDAQLNERLMDELHTLDAAISLAKDTGSGRALHILATSAERAAKITLEMERRGLVALD